MKDRPLDRRDQVERQPAVHDTRRVEQPRIDTDKRASSPLPQPTLPRSGGALAPISEKFSTNAQTGTMSYSVPIPTTPGRNGFGPQLALAYDSGSGNGAFGLGWSVGAPAITRKTDRGLPRYPNFGTPDDDVFILAGVEDLVPVSSPVADASGELVIAYRPRVDAMFARIERRRRSDGTEYWITITKDNVRSVFGASAQARIADPDDDRRVFRWSLEWSDDDRGNVVGYHYKAEDAVGAPNRERGRAVANHYLKAIGYLNETGRTFADRATSPIAAPIESWPLVVLFDYGEHDLMAIEAGTRDAFVESDWPCREDAFSSHRSTFEIRTRRLCRSILMLHRVGETGAYDRRPGASHAVVRVIRLGYQPSPRVTYLTAITHEGWRRRTGGGYDRAAFPAITLAYSTADHPQAQVNVLDAESAEGVLAAFDGGAASLVDYDGEGLPGVFSSQGDAWWYKRPNGSDAGARWAPPRRISRRPDVMLAGAHAAQLQDWNGDGALDVVQLRGPMRGVFLRQPLPPGAELLDEDWHPFRPFSELPADVDPADPNLRFVDLSGDGFPDMVFGDDDAIRWHAASAGIDARGRDGYKEERRAPKSADADDPRSGKAPIFANQREAVMFADMSGDGLADLVHVTATSCAYWPNLGYGRFGRRIVMQGAPVLASAGEFDPTRVRFADFDGTGVADLVYLDHDAIRIFPNHSGNAFGTDVRFPLAQPAHVEIMDLWGRGTQTIVWSSGLPRDRGRHVKYIDLFPDKPHLLRTIENGHGLTRTIDYAPSTKFYLADRRAGRPWITRLPFPVQVIERVTTADAVSGTRTVGSFAYHHGYYDGAEREFRGFGMVETRDSEDFGALHGVSESAPAGIDRTLHRPPVVTKTWFHTGAFVGDDVISRHHDDEYDHSDPLAANVPDTVLPPGLLPDEAREAVRALRGRTLRVEIYAEDGDPADPASFVRATRPFSVAESNFTLALERARGDGKHAVFAVHPRETLSYHYERDPADPRITHELVTKVSPSGAVIDKVSIAYPRRGIDVATVPKNLRGQGMLYATLAHAEVRDAAPGAETHRRDVPVREDLFDLIGLPAMRVLGFDEIASFIAGSAEHAYVLEARTDDRLARPAGKHVVQRVRYRYWDDTTTSVMPIGAVTARLLPARTETLGHTAATLAPIAARDPALDFTTLLPSSRAGYLGDPDGTYWVPSATMRYAAGFFAPVSATNPFGGITRLDYDALFALPRASYDAMDNPTTIERDYRLFQPVAIEDPNGTVSSVETDVRGIVIATYTRQGTLGGQTASIDYGFFAAGAPSRVHVRSFPDYGAGAPAEESWLFSDGFGREALRKVRVPPGPASRPDGTPVAHADPRWIGTGHTIYDNKAHPVKQYEPYFSTTEVYESEDALVRHQGVTPVMRYDALGRLTRVDLPDGTFRETDFAPWLEVLRDEVDTLGPDVPWYDDRLALPMGDAGRIAAERAFSLRETPTRQHLDPLGRTILTTHDNRQSKLLETSQELDLEGNTLALIDPRAIEIAVHAYDVAGRCVEANSRDAGRTTTLHDAAGKPMIVWRGAGVDLVRIEHGYDAAERATHVRATDQHSPGGALRERFVYRDWNQGAPPANAAGRIAAELDGAGLVTYAYDFTGNPALTERRVAKDYERMPTWDAASAWTGVTPLPATVDGMLELEQFAIASTYDGMGRIVTQTAPDGSVTTQTYDIGGRLRSVAVIDADGATQSIIERIDYDEKSRRKTLVGGHQVATTYEYDPLTFRLARLVARGSAGERYQDLTYTYDPVGNIVRIRDAADDTIYYSNRVARPEMDYTYDALYRLVSVRGREHLGQVRFDQRDVPDHLAGVPITDPLNLAQIGEYVEEYHYDDAGNIDRFSHHHGATAWVRTYDYATTSNRLARTHAGGVDVSYAHDGRGNLLGLPHLDQLAWTHRDQMWRATRTKINNGPSPTLLPQAQPVYCAYDLRGQRVRKTSVDGAVRRDRIYIGAFEVFRETRGTTLELERTCLHVSDATGRTAMLERRTPRSPDDSRITKLWRFQHANHLGSAILELSESRIELSYEELHPYGTTALYALKDKVTPKRYRHTGKERDDETGLQCHGVRFYAPWLARWLSADPAGLDEGPNQYEYVHGRPVIRHDPSGLGDEPWTWWDSVIDFIRKGEHRAEYEQRKQDKLWRQMQREQGIEPEPTTIGQSNVNLGRKKIEPRHITPEDMERLTVEAHFFRYVPKEERYRGIYRGKPLYGLTPEEAFVAVVETGLLLEGAFRPGISVRGLVERAGRESRGTTIWARSYGGGRLTQVTLKGPVSETAELALRLERPGLLVRVGQAGRNFGQHAERLGRAADASARLRLRLRPDGAPWISRGPCSRDCARAADATGTQVATPDILPRRPGSASAAAAITDKLLQQSERR